MNCIPKGTELVIDQDTSLAVHRESDALSTPTLCFVALYLVALLYFVIGVEY